MNTKKKMIYMWNLKENEIQQKTQKNKIKRLRTKLKQNIIYDKLGLNDEIENK
jgi:tRNA(His) 5'-end guanylyltransferase